ncbi:MAG: UvrD-helicase domain-containing protein [Dehalococcoidia bacterium]|nr:UvrD-helicase domain-containing protein [Dehalococcoidia bacterium]MDW8120082.1 UvrD-helicase domain-containing protein [Chloroflexota bacterium]
MPHVSTLLESLNPSQREAVTTLEGPLLIVAGPGSGKTRVIVHRIAYLVREAGVSPTRICAVTFTNRAARELLDRLHRLLGPRAEHLTCGTFHALCAAILRREGKAIGLSPSFTIYDEEDQRAVLKQAVGDAGFDPKRYNLGAIHHAISHAKARLLGPDGYSAQAQTYLEQVIAKVYQRYQALLAQSQAVDFDDLLLLTYQLFRDHAAVLGKYQERYLHLLIDEFQDTNRAQYALAKQLAGKWRNICVVGDPDQSIYSWRNADIRNILEFQKDFPDCRVLYLEENYRSTPPILQAAEGIIRANTLRIAKRMVPVRQGGVPIVVHEAFNEDEEAAWVAGEIERLVQQKVATYRQCVVLYRTHAQSRALEEAFLRYGIPYRVVGAIRFYQRREVKDLLAYLRLLVNPNDIVSLQRVINTPPRGIGPKAHDALLHYAQVHGKGAGEVLLGLAQGEGDLPLTGQSLAAVQRFAHLLADLSGQARTLDLVSLMDAVVERTGYKEWLLSQEDGEKRWENLVELRGLASEFKALSPPQGLITFLERVSLVSEQDEVDTQRDVVTLLTLHQAKGLEFPVVFLVGLEEGLLPHYRSLDSPEEIEEERRLLYVGMTRAQDRLYLLRAFRRHLAGESHPTLPSRFLKDLPPQVVQGPPRVRKPAGEGRSPAPSPPPSSPPPFKAGDRVRHSRFGEGVVISITPAGNEHEVTVAFTHAGVKRLLYPIAPLEPVV